uniref:Uncharacterized protein n=1 Tax=Anopheles stephensi TaxID=30069 RepID=A0A182YEE6_ANOST
MERCFSTVVCLLVLAVCEVTGEPEGRANSSSNGILVEQARYDHYEDIFRYWWPWFSDLATVVAIKLKIWIILVAMNVFGDGYYWSKWNGSSSQYVQPPGFGWTVALYIWYIVKLGFILGALLLLLFAKKWNTQRQPIIFESGPEF